MKNFLIAALLFCTLTTYGQNIQFITDGKLNLATFELYKPFEHGTLYYFTDFKMSKNGFDEVYSEISGYVNIYKTFSVTVQYNTGINKDSIIYPVYLGGLSKSFKIGKHIDLSVDALYRHQRFIYFPDDEIKNGYQITTTFVYDLNKLQASGYCDFWNTKYFILEPQVWYKIIKPLWIGLEWRMSNYDDVLDYDYVGNFTGDYSDYLMIGLKWNIN